MSHLFRVLSTLYRQRAAVAYWGYVRHDPVARLQLRGGREDPYAVYDQMRMAGPIATTRLGDWFSTSHRVCSQVLRDRRFGVLPSGQARQARQGGFDRSFSSLDPPDHSRLRRLAQPAFSPKAMAGYQQHVEQIVECLLDRAAAQRQFDLVSVLAAPLPIAVITGLLGIPDADADAFARCGQEIGSAIDGVRSLGQARRLKASKASLRAIFEEVFAQRRANPCDDIMSQIVAAEGEQIQPHEMVPICNLLLIAGFETTINLIGNAVVALLGHPQQWKELCADPRGLAPKVVEETLRFDPPVQYAWRRALETVEIEGSVIHKGQCFMALIGAANHDPQVFDQPSTFDIHREHQADHLAFSGGIHYCIGQPLAQLEVTVALRMLAERMPGLAMAGKVKRRNASTIRGPVSIPLTQ